MSDVTRITRKPATKSAFEMTFEEFQVANQRTIANLKAGSPPPGTICAAGHLVQWGRPEIETALGIRPINEETEADIAELFSFGKGKARVRYTSTNNATNRPLSDTNWQSLLAYFAEGRWGITGETLIFDETGMAASAQHRLVAAFVACLSDPEAKFYFLVVNGIATDVIDLIDTGKSRDLKDITIRHSETMLPEETLRDLVGNPYGKTSKKARAAIAGDIKQAMGFIWMRANAKDVNASTTEYKNDKSLYFAMLDRFEEHVFTDANGVEIETTTLARAANRIYAYDQQAGKTLSKYYGRGKVLAALILASNTEAEVQIDVEKRQRAVGGEQTILRFTLPDTLDINLNLVDAFCDNAKDLDGPFVNVFKQLESKSGKNRLDPQYKFGSLVNLVQYFQENASEQTIPGKTNEAGEVIVPERIETVCPEAPDAMIPKSPAVNAQGKRPPLRYPHFGGLDVGLQDKKAIEATAAIAEATEAANEAKEESKPTDPLAAS
jgi:hypothetical protein